MYCWETAFHFTDWWEWGLTAVVYDDSFHGWVSLLASSCPKEGIKSLNYSWWLNRLKDTSICRSVCLSLLQARSKLSQIQDSQHEVSKSIEQCNNTLNGTHGGSMTNLADMSETYFSERENGVFPAMVRRTQVRTQVEQDKRLGVMANRLQQELCFIVFFV